jgi:CBS domain-containing protein
MKLRDVMSRQPQAVREDDPLAKAAGMMKEYNIGSLPVLNRKDTVVGMITDRDITIRAVAAGADVGKTAVKDVMTPKPVMGAEEMDVEVAAELMAAHQIRRLPVQQNGRLTGMVALGDLAVRYQTNTSAAMALEEISETRRPEEYSTTD